MSNKYNDFFFSFGGIVPPIAQQLHRDKIHQVVTDTFEQTNINIEDIDAIAVTNRPGNYLFKTEAQS